MIKHIQRLFHIRIVRYALVGGIGIPINLLALAEFLYLMGDGLYPLALACSFEVSTTINFILNQLFTYREQKHLSLWGWIKRALKAQMTSLSALAVTYVIALIFKYGVHVNPYIASTVGIVSAFFYNFAISKRFVFRPVTPEHAGNSTQAASLSLASHTLSNPSSGYLQNSQGRVQAMQQSAIAQPDILFSSSLSKEAALSIVIPVMNEKQNVRSLYDKLSTKLNQLGKRYEVIFVDDGSRDGTFVELQNLHYQYPNIVHVVRFRRNFGKTPALVAGFSRCRGDVIFTMDGDLQDDPEEIPRFLAKLDEGYDLVTGWKFPRLDPITKTFPSRIFNGLVSRTTGLYLHDINNGFKAYRREVIDDIYLKLYGEFHRFIPVIAHWRGFRVAEIKVRHHPRTFGVSKFGGKRFARGLIDLTTVLFLTSFLHTPLRLFGKLGFWTFLLGIVVDVFVVWRRIALGILIHNQPLLLVGILLMVFGFLFVFLGLLGEMIRYYSFQKNEEYSIQEELEVCNDDNRNTVPAEIQMQQMAFQMEKQLPYDQLPQNWGQSLQSQWGPPNTRRRNIPHRSVIRPF